MKIGNKKLGDKTYVIAEFGVNHNGSLERAIEGVEKAAWAGADAIKFQTYTAKELVVKGTPKFWDWSGDKKYASQYDAYDAIGGFPYEFYPELIKRCNELGIEFLSTPFSMQAADILNDMGMAAFKVASSDMSTLPYLKHIARYGKPILLSTGASTMEEVKEAVKTIEDEGNDQIVIMQCTLKYPTQEQDANFGVLETYKETFPGYIIGLSDHTLGPTSSIIGCALGGQVIEKHYTVDKSLGESADHWLSIDPLELKELVDGCRRVETLRGLREKNVIAAEKETRELDKRSIVTARDIKDGEVITEDMITYKRPGTGIHPRKLSKILGKKANGDIKDDTILQWTHFQKK